MAYQDFLPASWIKGRSTDHPIATLRKEVDSLFDHFGSDIFATGAELRIKLNVSETDTEFCVTAELPGLTNADVDVTVTGERIIIKGQKKSEKEERKDEEGRQFHRVERTSGAFERMMVLPFNIDPDTVRADVKDGVLTVTIPKPPEAIAQAKSIKVGNGS